MYMSLSLGMIIILLPLLLLAFLIAVGVVLYRHPSKLQKKWYQVSLKKRRRMKKTEKNIMWGKLTKKVKDKIGRAHV